MTIGYIASAKTGNGLSRLMLKSNMPETWDCSPSVQGGITENGINGKQIYCLIDQEDETSRKYQRILAEAIISMELAENMLVVKTVSGMAMASAAALDSLNIIGIVGTIAGDDTIMCVMKDKNIGRTAIAEIDHMIKKLKE